MFLTAVCFVFRLKVEMARNNLTRIFFSTRVLDQRWVACARSQLHLRFLDVCTCILPHLPRFQVIQIEALSIRNNFDHQSGIDVGEKILFRVERHAHAGEGFEIK